TKTKTFASTEGMSPACKTALRDLLVACADTKLLLGYHYGEWTFGPPQLEAAIACCSLGQSELGHVRLLHGILNAHFGEKPEALVEARRPEEFANIAYLDHELNDWAEFVAANYVVDLAVTALLFALKDSSFQPLHMSLEKMLQEEKYHIHHGQGWFRSLAQKSDETRAALAQATRKALSQVVEWFGPPRAQDDQALCAAGIKSESNEAIQKRVLREIDSLASTLQVDVGIVKEDADSYRFESPSSWNDWNPSTRRIQRQGPDQQILYHLRGSKNQVFKLN
ncbi:MAG: Phenylacetic acid catabolic protein, partial [bacterium]